MIRYQQNIIFITSIKQFPRFHKILWPQQKFYGLWFGNEWLQLHSRKRLKTNTDVKWISLEWRTNNSTWECPSSATSSCWSLFGDKHSNWPPNSTVSSHLLHLKNPPAAFHGPVNDKWYDEWFILSICRRRVLNCIFLIRLWVCFVSVFRDVFSSGVCLGWPSSCSCPSYISHPIPWLMFRSKHCQNK